MEPAVDSGVRRHGDRPSDSVPRRPESRRVLARISYAFGQLHPAMGVLVMLAVSLVLSEALVISVDALLFDGDILRAAGVTAIVSPLVALPLVVFSIDTIKRLDHSKREARRMRDHAQSESRAKSEFLAELRDNQNDLAAAQRIAHIGSWRWDINSDEGIWSDEHWKICGFNLARSAGSIQISLTRSFIQTIWKSFRASGGARGKLGLPFSPTSASSIATERCGTFTHEVNRIAPTMLATSWEPFRT